MINMKSALLTAAALLLVTAGRSQEIYRHKSGGKYGFYNSSSSLIIPYDYEDALDFNENLAAVKKDSKWGYINASNKVVIPLMYDDAWYFTQGLAAVKKNSKWGYIDKNNATIIPFMYDDAADFSDGLAWVEKDASIGYITKSNTVAIPFQYNAANAFVNGVAGVQKNGQWGVINKSNTTLIPFLYSEIAYPKEGFIPVRSSSSWAYFDLAGNQITTFQFSSHSETDFKITSEFARAYAEYSYQQMKLLGKNHEKYQVYREHLTRATQLFRANTSYIYTSDWKALAQYYDILGDREKYKEAKSHLKKGGGSFKGPHLAIMTAPVKLLYTKTAHLPLYAELGLGKMYIGARYNKIEGWGEKYRFNAWNHDYEKANLNGTEVSGFLLFYLEKFLRMGVEVRKGFYRYDPVPISAWNSTTSTPLFLNIQPEFNVWDVNLVYSFRRTWKFFTLETGFSFGLGYKSWDLKLPEGDIRVDTERWNPDDWGHINLPMRWHFRAGFALF